MLFPCWLSKHNYSHQPEIALHLQGMSLRGSLCSCLVYEHMSVRGIWKSHMVLFQRNSVTSPKSKPFQKHISLYEDTSKTVPRTSLFDQYLREARNQGIRLLQEKWDAVNVLQYSASDLCKSVVRNLRLGKVSYLAKITLQSFKCYLPKFKGCVWIKYSFHKEI